MPERVGTEPSSATPRSRSGCARAYHSAQTPPGRRQEGQFEDRTWAPTGVGGSILGMGPSDLDTTYCSFTKAIEHLAERWSLLIVRELGATGPQGFNTLAGNLPGRISRSVLASRLRRLQDLGLVARSEGHAYCLTVSSEALMPTLWALRAWSESWLPEDPAMLEREPDVVLACLAQRVDRSDPLLDQSRYLHVRLGQPVLLLLARGRRSWREASADGSIRAYGDPDLVRGLPGWFLS